MTRNLCTDPLRTTTRWRQPYLLLTSALVTIKKKLTHYCVFSRVVYTVPLWPENLVSVCKPERETPLFHLGKNFSEFRSFQPIPANFGRFTFWGKLSSLQRSSSPPAPPHLRPTRLQLLPHRPLPAMGRIRLRLRHRSDTLQHHLRLSASSPSSSSSSSFLFFPPKLSLWLSTFPFLCFFSFPFWFECPSRVLIVPFLLCTFLV